jgi:hypothetical protein
VRTWSRTSARRSGHTFGRGHPRHIMFVDNFHDTAKIDKEGVNITMSGNVLVSSHDFPAAATAIMAAAGPINASWLR